MSRDDALQVKRNLAIRMYFKNLKDTIECGVRKYTYTYCIHKTSEKFYLALGTIKRIVVGI